MGFLKFLSKKKELQEELDIPPPPPPGAEDLGLTSIGEELPPPPPSDEEGLPPFPGPEEREELPPLPEMPEFEEEFAEEEAKLREFTSLPPKAESQASELPPLPPRAEASLKISQKPLAPPQPRMDIQEAMPIFVRANQFKDILKGINVVKVNLKKSDDVLLRLDDLENSKEREFTKWRSEFEDIQNKIMFVDKILFKGD